MKNVQIEYKKNDKGGHRKSDHFESDFFAITYVTGRDLLFIHWPINNP